MIGVSGRGSGMGTGGGEEVHAVGGESRWCWGRHLEMTHQEGRHFPFRSISTQRHTSCSSSFSSSSSSSSSSSHIFLILFSCMVYLIHFYLFLSCNFFFYVILYVIVYMSVCLSVCLFLVFFLLPYAF